MSKPKITPQELQLNLKMFTGTENYHNFNILAPNVLLTDGAKYLADETGAYWLMDIIASMIKYTPVARQSWFLNCTLTVNQETSKAVFVVTDGDKKVLYTQNIDFTDFPLESITLYCNEQGKHRIILLPSEY